MVRPAALGIGLGIAAILAASRRALARGTADAVADEAERELTRWGNLLEQDALAEPLLRRYWRTVGVPYPGPDTAWSAAFVSHVTHRAAPGTLTPSASHLGYAQIALDSYSGYRPLRPENLPIRRGDILIRGRAGSTPSFADIQRRGYQPTHGDIVTMVQPGTARAIGGNVRNAVSVTDYALTADGAVEPKENVFVVLRLDA